MNALAIGLVIFLILLIAGSTAMSGSNGASNSAPAKSGCACSGTHPAGPCKCPRGCKTCNVRDARYPAASVGCGGCSCGCSETGVCTCGSDCGCGCKKLTLHPNAFWEGEGNQAPAGFGLSSGEMKYQLPHPPHTLKEMADNRTRLDIDMDRKTRLGYPKNPSCPCESVGDQMKKAAAYNTYLWEQPAPIMNYFRPPYPEDYMSDRLGMKMSFEGYAHFDQSGVDQITPVPLQLRGPYGVRLE